MDQVKLLLRVIRKMKLVSRFNAAINPDSSVFHFTGQDLRIGQVLVFLKQSFNLFSLIKQFFNSSSISVNLSNTTIDEYVRRGTKRKRSD